MSLRCDHDIVASPYLYLFDQPARFNVQALEPTSGWCIDDTTLQSIIANNDSFTEHRKQIHLNLLKKKPKNALSRLSYIHQKSAIYGMQNPTQKSWHAHPINTSPMFSASLLCL